ncbi:proline racemase family protein [Streptomyces sp. NPDC054861]
MRPATPPLRASRAPSAATGVRTVDYHTAGDPFRIVDGARGGLPPVPGDTVAERCATAVGPGGSGTSPRPGPLDDVRRLLVREPRGHPGMFGGFVVPPDDDGAHLGALFWHKDGYATACGHGAMALGAWAVDTGRVATPDDGDARVRIDTPAGRVATTVHRTRGRTTGVTLRTAPARVTARKVPVATTLGLAEADLAHAGACYAAVRARDLGLGVSPDALPALVRAGREIRAALATHPGTWHPDGPLLSGLYGVILYEELPDTPFGPRQRSVTLLSGGQVTRSPCATGTSARLALLTEEGRLAPGDDLVHESVSGTVFTGRAVAASGDLVTEVTGAAHRTGEHLFVRDPGDALGPGLASWRGGSTPVPDA